MAMHVMTRLAVVVFLATGPGLLATHFAAQQSEPASTTATATFAGGCFWCMEPPFDALDGVLSTTSGYIGGQTPNPTYEEVSSGGTGHFEALEITYDPPKISYEQLVVEKLWGKAPSK